MLTPTGDGVGDDNNTNETTPVYEATTVPKSKTEEVRTRQPTSCCKTYHNMPRLYIHRIIYFPLFLGKESFAYKSVRYFIECFQCIKLKLLYPANLGYLTDITVLLLSRIRISSLGLKVY